MQPINLGRYDVLRAMILPQNSEKPIEGLELGDGRWELISFAVGDAPMVLLGRVAKSEMGKLHLEALKEANAPTTPVQDLKSAVAGSLKQFEQVQ